jgi:hypothetical protein
MAVVTLAFTTPAAAAGAAYADLVATSTDRLRLREIGLFVSAATATSVGLIRASTLGTRTSPVTGLQGDPAEPAATGTTAVAWSVAGTVGSTYLRKMAIPAAIGNGLIWTFGPNDLIIPVSGGVFLWNFGAGAGSICNGYFVWEE